MRGFVPGPERRGRGGTEWGSLRGPFTGGAPIVLLRCRASSPPRSGPRRLHQRERCCGDDLRPGRLFRGFDWSMSPCIAIVAAARRSAGTRRLIEVALREAARRGADTTERHSHAPQDRPRSVWLDEDSTFTVTRSPGAISAPSGTGKTVDLKVSVRPLSSAGSRREGPATSTSTR